MVSIRNVEKFFRDHPEFYEMKYKILGRADNLKNSSGMISAGALNLIFFDEKMVRMFIFEMQTDKEHLKLAHQEME